MYNCVVNRFKAAGDKIFFTARRKYIDLEILLRTFSVYNVHYICSCTLSIILIFMYMFPNLFMLMFLNTCSMFILLTTPIHNTAPSEIDAAQYFL